MYKVIGTTKSRALRVMWMLNEIGEPYEQIKVTPGSDKARHYSPMGTLPALVDGEEILTDSVAIMTYLADKHGKLTAPAGTTARAKQDAVTLWIIEEIDSVLRFATKFAEILPKNDQAPTLKDALKREFSRAGQTLSSRLEGDFLMGNTITLPDILACHCLNWAIGAKFPRTDLKLNLYAKALRERPAFQAAFAS
jgi:glutathione S-transferase